MKEEKTYPIYMISARWSQAGDTEPYKNYPKWTEGLPQGRFWNGTGFSKMFREEQSQEELDRFVDEWWNKYSSSEKLKDKDINLESLEIKFKEKETWHCVWFQHETFDEGQTDEEVLESFERFVRRKEALNYEHQKMHDKDQHCLMGAEDRWRWHGADGSDHSPAPCRCKYCKEQGLIRIAH